MYARCVTLLYCFSCLCISARGQIPIERQKKIWQAAQYHDIVRVRAIQELGEIVKHNEPAQNVLIDRLFAEDGGVLADLFHVVRVLSRVEPEVVERIVAEYKDGNQTEEKLERLLYLLGRMGPKAKSAIPFLVKELERKWPRPEMEGYIRVVLANLGWKSAQNLEIIRQGIQNRGKKGDKLAWMMSVAGPKEWVSDDLVKELRAWLNQALKDGTDPSLLAALLSILGEIDEETEKRLGALVKTKCRKANSDEFCIWVGFSLARSNLARSRGALKSALRCLGANMPHHTGWTIDTVIGDVLIGSDQRMMKELAKMLTARDRKAATGAL